MIFFHRNRDLPNIPNPIRDRWLESTESVGVHIWAIDESSVVAQISVEYQYLQLKPIGFGNEGMLHSFVAGPGNCYGLQASTQFKFWKSSEHGRLVVILGNQWVGTFYNCINLWIIQPFNMASVTSHFWLLDPHRSTAFDVFCLFQVIRVCKGAVNPAVQSRDVCCTNWRFSSVLCSITKAMILTSPDFPEVHHRQLRYHACVFQCRSHG